LRGALRRGAAVKRRICCPPRGAASSAGRRPEDARLCGLLLLSRTRGTPGQGRDGGRYMSVGIHKGPCTEMFSRQCILLHGWTQSQRSGSAWWVFTPKDKGD